MPMKSRIVLTFGALMVFAAMYAPSTSAQVVTGSIGSRIGGIPGGASRPSGSISGVVVDERGAPVVRASVQAIGAMRDPSGSVRLTSRGGMPTDEGGRFKIDGLPQQSFFVAAMPPFTPPRPGAPDDQLVYVVTYYPGVTSIDQAQAVAVAEGADVPVIIELRRVQPFHVRGTVTSPSGRSTAGLQVQIVQRFGSGTFTRGGNPVRADGTFDIPAVPPGTHAVSIRVSPMDPASEFATQEITIVDHDLDGIALVLGTGGSINGRVVFDGGAPGPAPLGAMISAMPEIGTVTAMGVRGPGTIAEDWTFRLRGLYGVYRFSLPTTAIGRYRVARIDFDGTTVGNAGVAIHDGDHQLIIYLVPIPTR